MKDKIEEAIDQLVEGQGDSYLHPWIVGKYQFEDWIDNLKDIDSNKTMVIVNTDIYDPAGKNIAIMGSDSTPVGN
jgi:hypothetical protein